MITATPIILSHQQKADGTFVVKIRLTYKRKTKYLQTNIIAHPEDVRRTSKSSRSEMKVISPQLRAKIADIKRIMDDAISKIPFVELESMTIDDVVAKIKIILAPPDTFRLNFLDFGMEQAKKKSPGSRKNYESALRVLERYHGSHDLDISLITKRFLMGFERFIENEPRRTVNPKTGKTASSKVRKGDRAVSLYLAAIRHIHNLARLEYNEPDLGIMRIPVSPFEYYKVQKQKAAAHRFIDRDVIQMMINDSPTLTGRKKLAVDAFLLSFLMFGMNAIDLYSCEKAKNGVLIYNRTKTKNRREDRAEMRIRIEPEMEPLIKEFESFDNKHMFCFYERYSSMPCFNSALNLGLREWIPEGIDHFTFYSARHAWATIARSKDANINKYLVNEGLVHVDESMRTTDIYAVLDWEVLWDANRKVIDLFDWSPITGK